jgi:dienelactone hydrolase
MGVVASCAAVGWCALSPVSADAGVHGPAGRPVMLLLPAGGFIFDIEKMPYAERVARRLGFRPRIVDYPEYDLPGAVRAVRAAARRARRDGRDVYAYGESAGGTLASLAAASREVTAAAVYCPIANLPEFISRSHDPALYQALIKASDRELRRYSPGLRDTVRPILAMRAAGDSAFMNRAIRRWDRRDREADSIAVAGGHIEAERHAVYRRNVRRGMTWLARSAGLD